MPLQVECIDEHQANEALEEVTLWVVPSLQDMRQDTQRLFCTPLWYDGWKPGGGMEGQNQLLPCAMKSEAPRS